MLHKSFFPHTLRELPVIMLHANDRFSFVARVVLGSCWSANTGLFVFSPCDIYGVIIKAPRSIQNINPYPSRPLPRLWVKHRLSGNSNRVLCSSNHCVYSEVHPHLDSNFFAAGASTYSIHSVHLAFHRYRFISSQKCTKIPASLVAHTFHSTNTMAFGSDRQYTDSKQIINLIRVLPRSASLLHDVRIHAKLLRLFELHRSSDALYQNLTRRECKEEMPQSTSRAFHCRLGYLHNMSIARTLVMPCTYEESQSILGTVARLLRPPRSQSAHINQDDAGDVEVDVPGDFIVARTHERNGGKKTRISRIWT